MQLLHKKINKATPIPLYFQLKNIILKDIESNELSIGDTLPTETEIAAYYKVSRSTVRQAMSELVSEGWLTRKVSKGTFVTKPQELPGSVHSFEPFYRQVSKLGKTPETELLDFTVLDPTNDVRKEMNLLPGKKVISIYRRRFADGIPMVTLRNYLPYHLCKFLIGRDFATNSLYELLMGNADTEIFETNTTISAAIASNEDIKTLKLDPCTPMLYFHNISTTKDGVVLDCAYAHYRGDYNVFEFEDRPKNK
jgi:GntR family transcriptional regulator